MRRFGRVEELVGAAVFLASDAAGVRHRPADRRRRRVPGERGQPVKPLHRHQRARQRRARLSRRSSRTRDVDGRLRDLVVREPIPRGHKVAHPRDSLRGTRRQIRQSDRRRDGRHSRRRARPHAQRRRAARGPRRSGSRDAGRVPGSRSRPRLAEPTRAHAGRAGGRGPRARGRVEPMNEPGFCGYRRADGRVGVRNHLLVVPTVICSSVVAERVAAAVAPIGDRAAAHRRLRPARARHAADPRHAGGVLRPSECRRGAGRSRSGASRSSRSTLPTRRAAHGKPAHIIAIQSEGGTVRTTARAIEIARQLGGRARRAPRECVRHLAS